MPSGVARPGSIGVAGSGSIAVHGSSSIAVDRSVSIGVPGAGLGGVDRRAAARGGQSRGFAFWRTVAAWVSLALLGLLLPAASIAQGYPQLHVVALAQHADRATVEPGGVFHVTIHVKVSQRRERLDELILGSFENCEIISNETVRTAAADGTDFVERLAVQALAPGTATISPAYIDATDPALGKPMRFSSNAIRVRVTGAAPSDSALQGFAATAQRALVAAAIVVGLFAAVFVLIVLFVRRRRRPAKIAAGATVPVPAAPVVAAPPVSAVSPNEQLARAAEAYKSERTDATLAHVRAILFGLAGVPAGATLIDALRALGERDRWLRTALLAAEDAAFGPAAERRPAGDGMLAAIQAYAGGRPANEDAWTR